MRGQRAYTILFVVVVLATSAATYAQDFQQLLSAVDRVETNLKALVEKEATARAADIAKLRKELTGQATSGTAPETNPIYTQLRSGLIRCALK